MSVLTVLTQNIWGGFPRWNERALLLAERIDKLRPEVVGLQEVHGVGAATQAHELVAKLDGYRVHFAPGRRREAADEGIALLLRSDARAHAPFLLTLDSTDRFDGQNQRVALAVTLDHPEGPVDIFVTHLSLSRDARTRTANELLEFIDRVHLESKSVGAVLCGDLNADPQEPAVALLESRLTDVWRKTHGKDRGGTWPAVFPFRRLDYVFTRGAIVAEECDRVPYSGSDHLGVLARLRVGIVPE